jgi:transposase
MAEVTKLLGRGGQRFAERVLKWNRVTIRKGQRELQSGKPIEDRFKDRGRKRAEHHLPDLLDDIKTMVDPVSQADPTLRSKRTYSPLTAKEIRRRLKTDKKYKAIQLPTVRTISNKLSELDIRPQRVKKCKPLRKIPETDKIFEQVHLVNEDADLDPQKLRISLDCKATVKIGCYSRGGTNRIKQHAYDHDFEPEETLTPLGIFLPQNAESHMWFCKGHVSADCMVDRLEELWPKLRKQFPQVHTLVINADNGSESNGQRTQWLNRLVQFSKDYGVTIQLAYYPPYHSKYNPVERLWGVLENHWRGELLSSVEKTLGLARTMTYRGIKPRVNMIRKKYKKGVRLTKKAMKSIEEKIDRLKGLEKWFITIKPARVLG